MNGMLKNWSRWELCWLAGFCLLAVVITLITGDNFFGFSVFLSGVLCVVLAAKGNIYTYPAGVYNTLGYAWMAWQNGLYGEMGLNLLFFMPMNIVGFFLWKNHIAEGTVKMRKLTAKGTLLIMAVSCVSIGLLGFALSLIAGQNTPYIDASTNVLSVVATVLMVRRYREQWLCYIVLNVLTVTMWSLRTIAGSPEGPLMTVMWSAYLLNAFYGWYVWSKGAAKEAVG